MTSQATPEIPRLEAPLLADASLPQVRAHARSGRLLALGLVSIGLGLAAVALLGPLFTGAIDYRVTETLRNQTIGLDAVSLFLVAPLSFAAAVLVLRSHVAGYALALGIGAYTAYMFVQYVLGPDYAHFAGNNERLFVLCLLLFSAGWIVALSAWNGIDTGGVASSRRRDRIVGLVVLPALGFVTFVRYVPMLADTMSDAPSDEGYLAGQSFFWAIALLDLGVLLPAVVAAAVGLARAKPWAQKALLGVVGVLGLIGAAVAAMAITMVVNDDPTASIGGAVVMTTLGLAYVTFAIVLYRPLFRTTPRAPHARSE